MSDSEITMKEESTQQSLLNVMNRFVHAVNNMDDTVMIPSLLRDMTIEKSADSSKSAENYEKAMVPVADMAQTDLHGFYTMLKGVKGELIRGPKSLEDAEEEDIDCTGSDSDQDTPCSHDGQQMTNQAAKAFRYHLTGLFSLLQQFTNTAEYLTNRYQEDLGDYTSPVSRRASSFTI